MSSEWQTVLLGDVAELSGGYAFKSEEYTESGHFVLRTVNITDDGRIDRRGATFVSLEAARKYERFALKPFDTLFVMVGATLGKTGFVKTQDLPALLNQNMWLIRAKPSLISPLYLHYAFKVFSQPLLGMASGSARGFVKRDDFRQMIIPLPSAPEQVRISSLLGALDDRITLLRETNATLEAIAQALFKSWFVDFDPVRAKQAGRAPEGMDEATAALFPGSFEESESGLVPKGWSYTSLRDVVSIFDSKRVPLSGQDRAKRQGPYPYYGAAALMDSVDDYLFDGVYLLTGEDGSVADEHGYPITQYVWGKIWVNNHAHVLQGKDGVSTEHVLLSLRRTNIQPFITGAVQAKLSQSNMWRISFMKPSREVSEAFGSMIEPLYARLRHNSEQAQTLATLRDTLLPRLISGQLRLPETEALIEEATA